MKALAQANRSGRQRPVRVLALRLRRWPVGVERPSPRPHSQILFLLHGGAQLYFWKLGPSFFLPLDDEMTSMVSISGQ